MRPTVRRLGPHVAALLVALTLGAAASRPGIAYTSDEGAGVLQARLLADTGSWRYEYPLRAIDPEDLARPFIRGTTGTDGLAPYAKHPVYPMALWGAERTVGAAGGLALSVVGTAAAALGAALLSRRFGERLEVVTLWVVGVGSPLLFDAWLVLAHTLAAATTVWAVVLAVGLVRPERDPARWERVAATGGVAALVLLGGLLRTEALLLGPALAVALLGAASIAARRDTARGGAGAWAVRAGLPAGAALLGAAGAWGIDRMAERSIVGTPVPQPGLVASRPSSWLAGRLEGLVATWFDPSYHGARSDGLLVLGLVALVVGAVLWRRRRVAPGAAALAVGAGLYVAAAMTAPSGAVPGLVMAFPLLAVGAVLADRDVVATTSRQVVVATALLCALAVLATQYSFGGGVEWGGRFFAFLVPLAAPVAVASVARVVADLGWRSPPVRVGVGALGVVALALAAMAFDAQRAVHTSGWDVLARVRAAAEVAGPTGAPTGRPVVVGDNRLLPQLLYPGFDEVDWVVPRASEVGRYLDRLPTVGVDRAVLVAADAETTLAQAPAWAVVDGQPGDGLDVVVIEHQG